MGDKITREKYKTVIVNFSIQVKGLIQAGSKGGSGDEEEEEEEESGNVSSSSASSGHKRHFYKQS